LIGIFILNVPITSHFVDIAVVSSTWLTTHFLQLWWRWCRISGWSSSGKA